MTALLIIFAITYVFIASEKVDKTIAAGLGASAAILSGLANYEHALEHIDLNVIFLLMGMMMIVNILGQTGIFEAIAITIAKRWRGHGLPILLTLLLTTAVLSAFLDNVTTVILIAPVTILICQVLELPAVHFLVLEAVFSNIGGTATLVGDPPNVMIGSMADIPFNDFLIHLGPVVLVILAVTTLILLPMLKKRFATHASARARIMKAEPALAITDHRMLRRALAVFALVLAGFFFGHAVHIEPGMVALAGGFLMTLVCSQDIHKVLVKVEWNTILFFIGLFMLVGALADAGTFTLLGNTIIDLTSGNLAATCITILWVSALASALVDNIPLVLAMIPMIKSIIPVFAASEAARLGIDLTPELTETLIVYPLYWSLALGACLGGNGSLVGASANVVIAQIARKNNYALSFARFTKTGFPVMILSLVIATGYVLLRYF